MTGVQTCALPISQTIPRISAVEDGYIRESLESKPSETVYEQYDKNLLSREQADLDWLAHWNDLGLNQWISAYFRHLISRPELDVALKAHALPKELNDIAIGVNRELIPIWLVPELMSAGSLSEADTELMFRNLGLDENNVKILVEYGNAVKDKNKGHNAVKLHQLSIGNLEKMYKLGIIDDNKFVDGLIKHGYSQPDAQLILDLTRVSIALKERDEKADEIITEINIGELSRENGLDKLYSLGYSDGEVSKFIERLRKEKVKRYKIPSEAQLNLMLEQQIISGEEWLRAIESKGYSKKWAMNLFALLEKEGKIHA